MRLKRLFSGLVACTLVLSLIPQFTFSVATAENDPAGRVNWTGYDERELNFDVWDGTSYDTSWYNEATGSKDDPYIIDSAADLAGLQYMTDHSENIGYGTVTPLTTKESNFMGKVRYAFYDTEKDPSDPAAWYYMLSGGRLDNNITFTTTCDIVEYELEHTLGNYVTAAYMDNIRVWMHVGNTSVEIDLGYEPEELVEYEYKKAYFMPMKNYSETGVTPSWYDRETINLVANDENCRLTDLIRTRSSYYKATADWENNTFTFTTPYVNIEDTLEFSCPLDSINVLKGRTAINAYGKEIELDTAMLHQFDIYTASYSSFSQVTGSVKGYPVSDKSSSTGFNTFIGHLGTTSNITSAIGHIGSEKTIFEGGYGEKADYSYFQNTALSTDTWYNTPDSIVYTEHFGAPRYKVTIFYDEIDSVPDMMSVTLNVYVDDILTETATTEINYNPDNHFVPAFCGYDINVTLDETAQTLTANVPKVYVRGVSVWGGDKKKSISTDNELNITIPVTQNNSAVLYALDGTAAGTYTSDGKYKLISSNCLTPANFTTQTTNWATAATTSAQYDHLTCDNQSFKNKYIKLMTDIDISAASLTIFPVKYHKNYGLDGIFDLNGYAIKGVNSNFIGSINKTGVLKNGHLELDIAATQDAIIYDVVGTLSDISVYAYSFLESEGTPERNKDRYFINTNNGEITDFTFRLSTYDHEHFIKTNNGLVKNCNWLYIEPASVGTTINNGTGQPYTSPAHGIYINNGRVENMIVDADEDVINNVYEMAYLGYQLIGAAASAGTVDGFCMKDFTIKNVASHAWIYAGGYVSNLEMYTSFERNNITANFYPSWTTCELTDSIIDMTSDTYRFIGTISNGTVFNNCDINYTGLAWETYGNYVNGVISVKNIIDSEFHIDIAPGPNVSPSKTAPMFFSDYNIGDTLIDNSKITIDLSKWSCYEDSAIRMNHGSITNSEITLLSPACSDWGGGGVINCPYVYNSKINLVDVRDYTQAVVLDSNTYGSIVEDTVISVSYTGEIKPNNRGQQSYGPRYINTEHYAHFNENATAQIIGSNGTSYGTPFIFDGLIDSLIVITNDSDNVVFGNEAIMQGASTYDTEYKGLYENSTILLDNLTFSKPNTALLGTPSGNSGAHSTSIKNMAIIAKNIKKTNDDVQITAFDTLNASRPSLTNNVIDGLYIDIEYADGHENTTTIGLPLRTHYSQSLALANIYMTSNTTSGRSALITAPSLALYQYPDVNYVLHNAFLDLPNAQTNLIPSETTEGFVPGLISLSTSTSQRYSDQPYVDKDFIGGYLAFGNTALGNVLVPTGHSAVVQYYNADTTTPDTWNIEANLGILPYGNTSSGDESVHGNVLNALEEIDVIEFDTSDPTCYIDGSLAYALDNGSSQYRRSQSWTVVDAFSVYNPLTDELVWEQDAFTGLANMHLPEKIKRTYGMNFEPVYKLTMLPADGGYVEVLGLGDETTSDGSVYVKRNTSVPTNEVVEDESLTFAYALQSFYDGATSRIPSTAGTQPRTYARRSADPTAYTINGYTVYAADTTIQPVFGTARYITVNLTGDENGTVIPSTNVSIAGETIRLQTDITNGYTVTDLAINGTPLTEMMFIMPDEDVEITGEIIPFDGGITQFSVYGFDGLIDQMDHTISVIIPKMGSLTNIQPEIEWTGKYISPSEQSRVDFTNPVTYTVTKDDDTTVDYDVTVTQSSYTMRIYEYEINGIKGNINHATRQIEIELPAGTDLSALTPSNIVYSAESIAPTSETQLDFRAPVVYTLSTTGMQNVQYTVTVKALGSSEARIDEYVYSGYSSVIDHDNETITLNIPALLSTTDVVPSILSYAGKRITPSKTTPVTLTNDAATTATYTVTAQNDSTKTYKIIANPLSDDTAIITEFELGGTTGIIDEDNKTITVTVSETVNIVDVIPDKLIFEGKSIYPSLSIERDFTQPQTYTVVAVDNSETEYTVNVVRQKNGAEITEFELLGYPGEIDPDTKIITVDLPYGVDISDIPPSKITYSDGATISPDETEKHDFNEEVKYTVTSEDGLNENEYTVIANIADQYDNLITYFELDGVSGEITNIGASLGTVKLVIKDYPDSPDWTNIIPSKITTSDGATLTPDDTTARNFTTELTYVVTGRLSGDRTYTVTTEIIPMSTDAEITDYKVDEYTGIIDQDKGTIELRIPESKKPNMTDVKPDITWKGKTLTPDDNVDLTKDITYTVTAEDPDFKKDYTITITWIDDSKPDPDPLDTTAKITDYEVNDIVAEIDQTTKTIKLDIPENKKDDFKNVVPDITWSGHAITPSDTTPVDLTDNTLAYTVFAEDPTVTATYTVVVNWTPAPIPDTPDTPEPPAPVLDKTAKITSYTANNIAADINQSTKTITLKIPENRKSDFKNVIPVIKWKGESLTPDETTVVDLTDNSLTYTVQAEDPTITATYTVKVNWTKTPVVETPPANTTARIWSYTIFGIDADIDQINNTITLDIPESLRENAADVMPDEIDWYGKSLTPKSYANISLIDPPDYVVTAEAGNTRKYTMIINWFDDSETEEPVPDKPIIETEEPIIETIETIETEEPTEEPTVETEDPAEDTAETVDTPDETDEPIIDEPDDEKNPDTSVTDYTILSVLLALTSALMFVTKKREA